MSITVQFTISLFGGSLMESLAYLNSKYRERDIPRKFEYLNFTNDVLSLLNHYLELGMLISIGIDDKKKKNVA